MTWTKSQLDEEWRVIYTTRLGVLCADQPPTLSQQKLAKDEADRHVAALKREEKK